MPPEAYTAAANAVKDINTELQFAAAVIIALAFLLGAWLSKVDRDSKKLVAEKEKAEIERTEHRKTERDQQINGIAARFDAVRVDTVVVERLIKQAEKKYVEVREVVIQSMERDTSCENKIGNVDYALRRFHGVGVRSENGNKD